MAKIGTIRLQDLTKTIDEAVVGFKSDRSLFDDGPDIVVAHDPMIVGFIVPTDRVKGQDLAEVSKLAGKIGNPFGGQGAVILQDKNLIVGFIRPLEQFKG